MCGYMFRRMSRQSTLSCYTSQHYTEFYKEETHLIGPSLEDLIILCSRKFSLETVLMLADQMINQIDFVQSKSFLHRDIKLDKFFMGLGLRANQGYIIDFGLVKRYWDNSISVVHLIAGLESRKYELKYEKISESKVCTSIEELKRYAVADNVSGKSQLGEVRTNFGMFTHKNKVVWSGWVGYWVVLVRHTKLLHTPTELETGFRFFGWVGFRIEFHQLLGTLGYSRTDAELKTSYMLGQK
ncbi:hypothetical protein CTI12_AA400320 [Artemisia annua]|uniref:Protein kinase domain-containing protein n=1 Tax=Artemisia annua TaxID=35608 RepID=A0A2U1MAX6_ARTAN|nr:hypothetical protein CTI12_AA400320 [Artemisia annua]